MLNFIYEYEDDYESDNAFTTGDKFPGPKSGLLSQIIHTLYGGTAMLGQVQEEIIEVGIYATNEMSLA